jgi:predicted  nucleic acid-binding Zn ribbon protein
MTDNDTLADNNIKHYGKLSTCYQYPTDVDSESITSSPDRICIVCGNDHSFRGNIKDAITFIDLLPEIFKSNINLQEFVN